MLSLEARVLRVDRVNSSVFKYISIICVTKVSDLSLGVKLHEFLFSYVSSAVRVTLGDKLLKLVVCNGELQVVGKNALQIVHCDVSFVTLIE